MFGICLGSAQFCTLIIPKLDLEKNLPGAT